MQEDPDNRNAILESELDRNELANICITCGKPMTRLREGSLTSWIFGDMNCSCQDERITGTGSESGTELATVAETSSYPEEGVDLPGRYQFLDLLGRGGMAAVFKCQDRRDGRIVAIKVLRPELARDPAAVKRFEKEATAAMSLDHRNLIKLYAYGNAPSGSPYLVMEYVEGESLSKILERQGKLEVKRSLRIFLQICDALEHAHSTGLVHRDLKPSNIIISKTIDGEEIAHLVDFGIAKVLAKPGETMTELTQSGELIGSPLYMSPEQCEGEDLDSRSDIYSLACVMFQCLEGRPPFPGRNIVKIILSHIRDNPPEVLEPSVPDELKELIAVCLRKAPEQRYQTVLDLANQLELLLYSQSTGSGIRARPEKNAKSGRGSNRRLSGLIKDDHSDKQEVLEEVRSSNKSSQSGLVIFGLALAILVVFLLAGNFDLGQFGISSQKQEISGVVRFYEPPTKNSSGLLIIQPVSASGFMEGAPISVNIPAGADDSLTKPVQTKSIVLGEYWRIALEEIQGEKVLAAPVETSGAVNKEMRESVETVLSMFNTLSKENITAQDIARLFTSDWSANKFRKFSNTWKGVKFKSSSAIAPASFAKIEKIAPESGLAILKTRTSSWIEGQPEHLRIELDKSSGTWKVREVKAIPVSEWLAPL